MQFFVSHWFTFYSLVQLLLLRAKSNGISHPISIEYKMVRGLNQAVFIAQNFKMFPISDLSSFQLWFRTGLKCYIG